MKRKQIRELKIDLGKELVQGMREVAEGLAGKDFSKVTTRTVKSIAPIPVLKSRQVRAIRQQLAMSQVVFADAVGVSPQLVRAWEQGQRKPSRLACRFLDGIRRDPSYWRRIVHA